MMRSQQTRVRFAAIVIAMLGGTSAAPAATHTYVGPGGAIPDDGSMSSPITVPDDFFIVDVTVHIEGLQHDACGQLRATLVHSGLGLSIPLFIAPGGVTDDTNFNGTYTFNNNASGDLDQSAIDLGDLDVLPPGSYLPYTGNLLDGMGQSGLGSWTLQIQDLAVGTVGSFAQWTLEFQGAGPVMPILYVDDGGTDAGDGSNWAMAYPDLRHALLVAQVAGGAVTEIRIGAGTYRPSLRTEFGEPKSATFGLFDGLTIRGGYAGLGAPDPDAYDPDLYPTILSGDQLGNDVPGSPYTDPSRQDNAAHVLVGTGCGPTALLEGVTVTAGFTFGGGGDEVPRAGAGLLNAPGDPTVRDCRFTGNWARVGGAGIFNYDGSAPTIDDCRFDSNIADSAGGGIRNDSSSPIITNCVFELNIADDGGAGIMNITNSSPMIDGCTFTNNTADIAGGAVRSQGNCYPTFTFCTFTGNTANFSGGAIFSQVQCYSSIADCDFDSNHALDGSGGAIGGDAASITDCTFTGNTASVHAGALVVQELGATIDRCDFTDNTAGASGGAMIIGEPAAINACTFSGNDAEYGGGIYNERTGTPIVDCAFNGNTADYGGGLYCVDQSDGLVINSIFAGNHAVVRGGGAFDDDQCQTSFTNCLFTGNTAGSDGGGLAVDRTSTTIVINGTFSLNSAGQRCGGAFVAGSSALTLANTVLWGNHDLDGATDTESEQVFADLSSVTVDYCCIEGLTGSLGGTANIGTDPIFVDADGADDTPGTADDDARLQVASPSQNSGDPTAPPADVLDLDGDGNVAETIPYDLDGLDRVYDFIVDRGAYEVQQSIGGGDGVWVGPPGGSWNGAENWESGTVPGSDTNVVLPVPVVISANGALAANVTILDGGGLTIGAGSLATTSLTVETGGELHLADPSARLDVGALVLHAGVTFDWTAGTIALSGGTWSSAGALVFGCIGTAVLDLGDGGHLTTPSVQLCSDGSILGNGTVTGDLVNGGTVVPGLPQGTGALIGALTIEGTYVQEMLGVLAMEMTDYTASATGDLLDITGTAALGGLFQMTVFDPSQPELMVRTVVRAASVTGTFDAVTQTDPVGPLVAGHYAAAAEYRVGVSVAGPRLFVDLDAAPGGVGQSWGEAQTDLQLALLTASLADGAVTEIWVAEGTYVPVVPDEPGDPRTASFYLTDGSTIYGGFAGDESELEDRDIVLHPTILSGDRYGNDGPDFLNNGDNVYNVVRATGTLAPTAVDGVTIRGGYGDYGAGALLESADVAFRDCRLTSNESYGGSACYSIGSTALEFIRCTFDGNDTQGEGGGLLVNTGTATLTDCSFFSNVAGESGAGAYAQNGAIVRFDGCTFTSNISADYGGAVSAESGATIEMWDCDFDSNSAQDEGGAIYLLDGIAEIVRCVFTENHCGTSGGAMYAEMASSSVVVNSRFLGNTSSTRGGAMVNRFGAEALVVNCIFSGNFADRNGGAIYSDQGHVTLRTCTVVNNVAHLDAGGGIWNHSNSVTRVANCISWGNSAFEGTVDQAAQLGGSGVIFVNHCCIQGWISGSGVNNFGLDPRFVDADGLDDLPGTVDDDVRLYVNSPCIDVGDNDRMPADVVDLDGDFDTSEPIPLDLAGIARFIDDPLTIDGGVGTPPYVDLGCFEFEPACPGCPGARVWTDATGGVFDDDTNWFPDAPLATDAAIFDLADTYVVTFGAAASTDQVMVTSGAVTFALGGYTYALAGVGGDGLVVGMHAESTAQVTIQDGTVLTDRARVGVHPGSEGTLVLDGPGLLLDTSGEVVLGDRGTGALALRGDGVAQIGAGLRIYDHGTWRGDGTVIANVTSNGTVDPGDVTAAELVVDGDYVQVSDAEGEGQLRIDLGGLVAGTDHDLLTVTGPATLAGTLAVTLSGGYVPELGDTFTILTAASIAGEFDFAFLPPMGNGLVMTQSYVDGGATSSIVLSIEELGAGFFAFDDAVIVGGFAAPSAALAADLNGDDFPDIAVLVPAADDNDPGVLLVFRNLGVDGQGNWLGFDSIVGQVTVDREPRSIATGYFNDDSHVDLVVGNFLGPKVTVLVNDAAGSGAFSISQTITGDQGSAVYGVASGKLYGGARDDIVYARGSNPYRERFYRNDGTGNFTFAFSMYNAGSGNPRLATVDLDLDGDIEVIQVGHGNSTGNFSSVSVSALDAGGSLWESTFLHFYDGGASAFTVVDIDDDGYPDVCTVNDVSQTMSILVNSADGSATLVPPIEFATGMFPSAIQTVDFDADGAPDVAIAAEDESGQRVIQLKHSDLIDEGTLTFTDASPLVTGGGVQFVLTADLDGDGSPDIIGVNNDVSAGAGSVGVGSLAVMINRVESASPPCPADINGDQQVSFADLIDVLSLWGPCGGCPADIDGDGVVGFSDLLAVLSTWGACPM